MRHSKPVRLETAPTGRAKVSIYFVEFTIKHTVAEFLGMI